MHVGLFTRSLGKQLSESIWPGEAFCMNDLFLFEMSFGDVNIGIGVALASREC